jgi:Ca2+-binding RTX toxin-like protein
MATFIGDPLGVVTDDVYSDDAFNVLYGLDGDDDLSPFAPGPLTIYGGDGDDLLFGFEDTDELYGGRGDDNLIGSSDIDLLDGGSGDDLLDGGLGPDILFGGTGADVFMFFFSDDVQDRVHDFDRKEGDSISLFGGNFTALTPDEPLDRDAFYKGKNAQEGDDHIGYDRKSGKMYYDENGDQAGGRTLIAQFDKGAQLKFSDIDVSPAGVG